MSAPKSCALETELVDQNSKHLCADAITIDAWRKLQATARDLSRFEQNRWSNFLHW